MVDQTKIASTNGTSPSRTVARNVGEAVHDVISLLELQIQLLTLDARQATRRSALPALLLGVGVVVLLSGFPILLLSVAYAMVELWDVSRWLALLIAAAIALVVGGLIGYLAWKALLQRISLLQRSQQELSKNFETIKHVLRRNDVPSQQAR